MQDDNISWSKERLIAICNEIIKRKFNLDIKNPYQGEIINHDPDELLKDYHTQQEEIQSLRDQLKDILCNALTNRNND